MSRMTMPQKFWTVPAVTVVLAGAWIGGALVESVVADAAEHGSAGQAAPATTAGAERTQPVLPPPAPGSELAELIKRGATMEEIARIRDPIAKSPDEAIYALKSGNARFYGGTARRPELSANERRAQILAQSPFAAILGCSDSRVPTEIVYDQSLGSLFVVRVAGNVVEPATVGSVEYAVQHLKSHVVVVMGHEGCGAVAAAMLSPERQRQEPENVRFLLERIVPAVAGLPAIRDHKARMREAVIANVRLQVHHLKQNRTMAAAIKSGKIKVIGAFYEIGSGAVDFLETDEELRLSPDESRRAALEVRQAGQKLSQAHPHGAHTHTDSGH